MRDYLPVTAELADEQPVESYFDCEESADLEFKASAFANINPWALGGQKLEQSEEVTNDGVLKSIVGFLNASGGKVVVGVMEAKKFQKPEAAEKLKDFPQHGQYIVCGVNLDFFGKDVDWFLLRLQDLVRSRISPPPIAWVDLKIHQFQGRDVCVVSVRPVVSGDWFYLQKEKSNIFYVRQQNRTLPLSGPEADEYKRSNPR